MSRPDDGHGPCAWLTDCIVPLGVASCCFLAPLCSKSTLRPRAWAYNKLTTWHVQNAGSCCAAPLEAYTYWFDMTYDFNPTDGRQMFCNRRDQFGGSYAVLGKVCLADADAVNKRLLEPMDRGDFLGATNMRSEKLPRDASGVNIFPLALPSGDVPGQDGRHAAFRTQLSRFIFNQEGKARAARTNLTTGVLLSRVASAYREAHAKGTEDAIDDFCSGPLADFVLRFIHWTMLGLNLGDDASDDFKTIKRAYFEPGPRGSSGLLYWLWGGELTSLALRWVPGLGTALGKNERNVQAKALRQLQATVRTPDQVVEQDFARAAAVYDRAPALEAYAVDPSLHNCPTKSEFISQLIVIVTIAALQGPLTLLSYLVTPDIAGSAGTWHPFKGIPPDFELPLDDRDKLRLVILEVARLYPPVNGTAYKTHAPVTVPNFAGGADHVFPRGCPFKLSYVCSQTDPKAWGPDPLKFDPYGNADKLWGGNAIFNGFNSVGDKGERICPGRELALEMAIDFMQAIHAKPGSSSVVQKPSQKPGSRFNSFKGKKPR